MAPPALSVVVPAYNEAAGIAATLASLHATLDALGARRTRSSSSTTPARRHGRRRRGARRPARARAPQPARTSARAARCGAGCSRPPARCGCTATPTAARRCSALAAHARAGRGATTWSSARGSRRAPPSAGASRCAGGSRAAASGCSAVRCCASRRATCSAASSCGAPPAAEAAYRATGADRLDVRRRDARDGARARLLASPRPGSRGPTARARACRWPRVIVPVTRELLEARRRGPARRRGRPPSRSPRRPPSRRGERDGRAAAPARPPARRRIGRSRRACSRRWPRSRSPCSPALLLKVWLRGGVVTGADGFLVADPLQYLDWTRQAGEHGADRQPARPRAGRPRVPASRAAALRAGLAAGRRARRVAYLLWKPVAVGVLFAGTLALVRRFLDAPRRPPARRSCSRSSRARRSPRSSAGAGSATPGDKLAGRLHHRRAVGRLLPLGLPVHGDRRRPAAARRCSPTSAGAQAAAGAGVALAAARGLLCAWLQPWQGATFAFVARRSRSWSQLRRGRTLGAPRRATSRCRSPRPPRRSPTTRCSARFDAVVGARRRASTTCRAGRGGCCVAGLAAARGPGGVRLPAARARLRRRRAARLAARGAAASTSSRSARSRSTPSRD